MSSLTAGPSSVSNITRGDLSAIRLAGRSSVLEIAPHGAHVLGWEPIGTRPVLFLSPRSLFAPGKAIRGGVPLVFPWFGPKATDPHAPSHGFARVRPWTVETARVEADGSAFVALNLTDDEETRKAWPHAFAARLTARAGQELHVALEVRNAGQTSCTFEAALHTYFAVSDVRHIQVQGLANTEYSERYGPPGRQRQKEEGITFAGEVDRLYFDTTGPCTMVDPEWKRRILIAKSGSRTTVVWNPGETKGRAVADLGDPAWKDFVCVETANAGPDAVTLAPGATHVLAATISVQQE